MIKRKEKKSSSFFAVSLSETNFSLWLDPCNMVISKQHECPSASVKWIYMNVSYSTSSFLSNGIAKGSYETKLSYYSIFIL